MDSERLIRLEEKYWAGETSIDEEQVLESAALNDSAVLTPELKRLYSSVHSVKDLELGEDFDAAFWNRVEKPRKGSYRVLQFASLLKYAAVGIITIGISLVLWNIIDGDGQDSTQENLVVNIDTFESPEAAFEETKRALLFASEKLNKGTEPVQEIKRFHTTKMSIIGTTPQTDSEK